MGLRFVFLFVLCCTKSVSGQKTFQDGDPFKTGFFIENKGQFNGFSEGAGNTRFAVDHAGDRIFFTPDGFDWIFVNQIQKELPFLKSVFLSAEAKEKAEERNITLERQEIGLRWLNANPHANISGIGKSAHYFSYGEAEYKSYGYKKIIYHNLYPNIDLEYVIHEKGGVKYSLILRPGADIRDIAFQYTGKGTTTEVFDDSVIVRNADKTITETGLKVYDALGHPVTCHYVEGEGYIGFKTAVDMSGQALTIDPWISHSIGMTGGTSGSDIGYDVDFDYEGNLYVYGGSPYYSELKVSKFNPQGYLIWTFSGYIAGQNWYSTGRYSHIGNFVVEKTSGKVFIGQGYNPAFGATIARLDSSGIYDNFISKSNISFNEIWEMNFSCDQGNILGMGGGTSSNINMGVIKPNGSYASANITGNSAAFQDILNSTFDSKGKLYVIMASSSITSLNNVLISVNSTYNGNLWIKHTGFKAFSEADNKRYVRSFAGNGHNSLSANKDYLYYYDGKRLAAYNKNNGSRVGSYDSIKQYKDAYQGGIYADDCNNIYVGGDSGMIHVYQFNGSKFKRNKTIVLNQSQNKKIHDIKYNPSENLLYICGDSLVAKVSPVYDCDQQGISLNIKTQSGCDRFLNISIENYDTQSVYTFIWSDSITGKEVRRVSQSKKYADTLYKPVAGHIYHSVVIQNALCGGNSIRTRFDYSSSYADTVFRHQFCRGDSVFFRGVFYTSSKTIIDSIPRKGLCDSLVMHSLEALPEIQTLQNRKICAGDSLRVGNHFYHITGLYSDTLKAGAGCDSVVITGLEVQQDTQYTRKIYLCDGDTLYLGTNKYTQTGVYTENLSRISGCDSVVITDLTVLKNVRKNENITLCDDQPVMIRGKLIYPPAVYSDTLSTYQGCDSIISVKVTRSALKASFDTDSVKSPLFRFRNTSMSGATFQWNFGDLTQEKYTRDAEHNYGNKPGTYRVCLYVTDSSGCRDSVCRDVSNKGLQYYLYNVFTPGEDGHNDTYKIGYAGYFEYDLLIYNRWGELVYETRQTACDDASGLWNGKVMNRGSQCPEGSYFSIFRIYTGETGSEPLQVTGVVTLLRE